ncbi:MAG TPA: M2 family metallopeptidase [Candidatus Limnocylindria bacterium]|nr:M2 family metallopeptidase [Candidatus Limnocylindria bacterium]
MKSLLFIAVFIAGAGLDALAAERRADPQQRADDLLQLVNSSYQALYKVESEAQWKALTDVKPEHDAAAEVAGKARAAFNGNPALIREAQELLKQKSKLKPITVRELDRVLLNAAEAPMTNPELVADRIKMETQQASTLNGFVFKLDGTNITVNQIDNLLQSSTNLEERRKVWETSKQSGPALKPGLMKLQKLRNGVAQELGHKDYFALQVASYQMTTDEMVKLQDEFMRELRPLFLQLHTYTKHELAKKYGQPVPKRIPAHWINNRWGQEWSGIVEAAKLDSYFTNKSPEWIVKTAEDFYVGMGFPKLPQTFWSASDLYPIKPGEQRKKNTHASCWHVDLDKDIRSLMSVEPNPWWFTTTHHELGHGYYFMAYTRPEVPPLLRIGANPAFHEGMGELISLAAGQVPYLQTAGILPKDFKEDQTAFLLDNALAHSVPFIAWASGTMTHWEADVYAKNLPPEQWNARWWDYVKKFQGIEPPADRGEESCDAATKTHINDTPAYYYSYAIATVLKFQFHDHIARKILKQPPQRCDYAGSKEAGKFLQAIMAKGGTEDWRKVLRDATGENLSTRAMVEYFKPLTAWLAEQNRGRQIGWE